VTILAIESASTDPSIALATTDGELLGSSAWSGDSRQGSQLLPRVLELLAERGAALADLGGIAIGTGPGSFTGLRVGMSVAKGLALGLAIPIIGLPSIPAWLAGEPTAVAALNRAGARDAYLLLRGETECRTVPFDALTIPWTEVIVAPRELADALSLPSAVGPRRAATELAAAAARRFAADPAGDDLSLLEPAYLRQARVTEPTIPWR